MFSNDRNDMRRVFFSAWEKHKNQQPVEPLEAELITIMLAHPEYHALFDNPEENLQKEFTENNPFLHLSLHLAVREQVKTNRPPGIQVIYTALQKKYGNAQATEHEMIECLARILWEAQRHSRMPDEGEYMELLKRL